MDKRFKLKPLKFEEAKEFFADKVVITPDQFAELYGEMKTLAFTVAGIETIDMLNDVFGMIQKSIEEGTLLEDFKKEMKDLYEKNQMPPLAPYKIETIYRNNLFTAFNAGRYKQQTDPAVVEKRPYWMYDCLIDGKERPSHRAMNGVVKRYDDPFWDEWYPPNGHRCRCGVRNLTQSEMESRGLQVSKLKPIHKPDEGWEYNPGKAKWNPDLEKYPEILKKAYQERLKQKEEQGN